MNAQLSNKKMKKLLYLSAFVLVLCGCGQKHKAKALIGSFVEENTTLGDMRRSYDKVDSTFKLTDSIIQNMQKHAPALPHFKKDITFGQPRAGEPILYTRTRFTSENDTLHYTFYMDRDLTQVIACKEN